ncbi:MAG: methyltransferase domain-containing protein [Sphingobium sp.]
MTAIVLKKKKPWAEFADRVGRFLDQWGLFFRQFVRHPGMIGSAIPSSPQLVDAMLDGVDWQRTRLFVEYGPGVGTFTRTVLERLPADATLLAIDLNPDFIAYLGKHFHDPRLRLVLGSAIDVERHVAEAGHDRADYVLSGLPFSTLPEGVDAAICDRTRAILRPGGRFLVYQYSARVRRLLAPRFADVVERWEWRNVPPCRLFYAQSAMALDRAA